MKKMTVEQIVAVINKIVKNDRALERFAEEAVKHDDLYRNTRKMLL